MILSIITINYNNIIGLKKTIDSVITQTSNDFEWIIIDGGSTDGSKKLIDDYSGFISYSVSEPDNGIYNAMNKGIYASHGKYILFLNSGDSLFERDTIKKVLPYLTDQDIYVGRILSEGKTNESFDEQSDYSPMGILNKLTFTWIPHQASFFKRTIFDEYGFYREDIKIVSDWWFYFYSLVLGKASIISIPHTIAIYDTTGVSTNRFTALDEQEKLLQEYPSIKTYYHFYKNNKEIIQVLKQNKLIFLLFRIYFFLYRKFH